jgi:hypothetical protein
MGAAAFVKCGAPESLSVDPPELRKKTKTFSRQIFKKYEWEVLKIFCQKYSIRQADLIRVFQTYLNNNEAYLRGFFIYSLDVRRKFSSYTRLIQEIADIFIPSMYLRDFAGLDPVVTNQELSFARFIVTSYIFGCMQFADLIYSLFAILRQNLKMQLSAVVSSVSFSKIISLLMEEIEISGCKKILLQATSRMENGQDVRLRSVIHMGVKYPLLFYALEKFRKYYKRFVFGDIFWKTKKLLKLQSITLEDYCDSDLNFQIFSESYATKRTAQSIIADCLSSKISEWQLSDTFHLPPTTLSKTDCTVLKSILGYVAARKLIQESAIPCDHDAILLHPFIIDGGVNESMHQKVTQPELEAHYGSNDQFQYDQIEMNENQHTDELKEFDGILFLQDNVENRDFKYDVNTGRSRWQQLFFDSDGDCVREVFS